MHLTRKRRRLTTWLHGEGIEVGALHNPLPVPADAHVTYVDRLTPAQLREHYPELGGSVGRHTLIGDAEDLSALDDESLDFVIANHLIEHLENPIRGLQEFHRLLKQDGVLYLAVPDARLTFDRRRPLTPVDHLLDDYRHGPQRHRQQHYREWVELVERSPSGPDDGTPVATRVQQLIEIGYSIHFHVWRPESFLDFYRAAKAEAGLDFELVAFASQEEEPDDEFILVLAKGSGATARRPPPSTAGARAQVSAAVGRLKDRVRASPLGPYAGPAYRSVRRLVRGR